MKDLKDLFIGMNIKQKQNQKRLFVLTFNSITADFAGNSVSNTNNRVEKDSHRK